MRGYCLCHCKTFSLVPDSTECRKIIFTKERVYMRPKENSNRFEISLQDKVSLRREVTSLSAFT